MTATISIVTPPNPGCVLCDRDVYPHGTTTVIEAPPDFAGFLCDRCLQGLMDADDPSEWLRADADALDSQAVKLQDLAGRMRTLAEVGVQLPSREELQAVLDEQIPF